MGMTYRERRERRAQRREEWAEGRKAKAETSREGARQIADAIPFGQPILVGHHSEKRARRDADRIHRGYSKAAEHDDMATKHHIAADTIRRQLATSVYDDDHDATARLRARITRREAERERIKKVNALARKFAKAEGFRRTTIPYADTRNPDRVEAAGRAVKTLIAECEKRDLLHPKKGAGELVGSWAHGQTIGYGGYVLTNLGGAIRRDRKRLARLERSASTQ